MKTETLPDYEIAELLLGNLFASLNLPVTISAPVGVVKDKWAAIQYAVKIGRESFEYMLGIGHVDWKKARTHAFDFNNGAIFFDSEDKYFLNLLARGGTPKDKDRTSQLVAKVAKMQKVEPNPAQVLACVCREGYETEQYSFEDWAASFGYDVDSIKAKETYDLCCDNGRKARRLVGNTAFEQMADLANQL